jgi:Na+-driven multidrug efflux pump
MTDGLSIGWSNDQQTGALRTYRTVLAINLVLHLIVGLSCLFFPDWVAHVVGLPEPNPAGWTRGWGRP